MSYDDSKNGVPLDVMTAFQSLYLAAQRKNKNRELYSALLWERQLRCEAVVELANRASVRDRGARLHEKS